VSAVHAVITPLKPRNQIIILYITFCTYPSFLPEGFNDSHIGGPDLEGFQGGDEQVWTAMAVGASA
jgi:hypothetical protein